ncbi:MAG: ATP-dependent DNA helicase, partial [Vulcanimicrobiota bacterium]
MPQNFKELWGIISGIFDEAGELSKTLPGFELRPGQNRMVEAVFETFVEDGITAIEAGTGIGKTFAYLIPAVYISRALGEPVVVSTKTINLQEQILNKDIPFMQNSLKEEFSAVMVKGWGNYLCLRRLRKIQSAQAEFDYEEMVNFKKLENWAKKTTTGDRSDIEFEVISRVWDQIKAEYSVCSNRKCPWYSKCFFFNNRRKQKKANILITNHALLFSHLASIRNSPSDKPVGILPEFKRLILDEAHHIEEVASDFLGESASSAELYSMMDTLLRSRGRLEESGLLPRIRALKFAPSIQDTIRNIIDSYCIPQLNQLKLTAVDFFYEVSRHPHLEREKDKIRLTPDFWNADYDLSRPYQSLLRELNGYRKHLSVLEEEIRREDEELSAEISGVICQLENYRNSLVNTWNLSDEDKIYSLEYNRLSKPAFVHFKSYPLSVSEILYKELFKNMKSVVLTSATLA